ncbi:unnamed protein product [Parnassius apollo]|uniref:(apollo) hypothetical protein n=1 Tax=Parnassius apollo TaxID=110799 RepID=A0A8S3XXX4_PARAO|nr:unnamed protein product [Parnassius apollo]
MEHRRLRKGPLPGGRQGASGAGAGRDSMRTASRARGAARPPSSPSHPSSPPACLVSAGSSQAQQSAPATGGVRRMRWTINMNSNALRAYFRAKGGEIGGFAYRARMHRLFTELEPSITVTEQNLADRVRYILRSNIFDGAELERLRREAVPSSNENATTEGAVPQVAEQPAHVDAAENTPVVADSNDDGTFTQELEIEQMRSTLEEAIMETRSTPLENRPRLPRIALSKRNRAVVRALNPMLVTYLEASRDLCETDSILFGAALAVCRIIGAKLSTAGRTTGQSSAIPAWRTRIEERIAKARALIGRLICFRSGNTRPRIVRTVRMAFAGTNVSLSQPDIMQKLTERIDDLKQRIAAWGKRIRRYTERSTRFNQNRLFQSDQKRLYKSLERPMVSGTGPVPNQADTVAFWRSLWSEPVNHNEGPWTEVVASQCAGITPMDPVTITPDDVAEAVRRAPNWKSPGLDGLHHYWLKGFVGRNKIKTEKKVDVFWTKLSKWSDLTENKPFSDIYQFALDCLVLPHANADCERIFSKINLTKSRTRNRLVTGTIDEILLSCVAIKRNKRDSRFKIIAIAIALDFEPMEEMLQRANNKSNDGMQNIDQVAEIDINIL